MLFKKIIGIAGFEPTTFCSQSRRSTRLSYIPKLLPKLEKEKIKTSYFFLKMLVILPPLLFENMTDSFKLLKIYSES